MPIDYEAGFEELYAAFAEAIVAEATRVQIGLDVTVTREEIRIAGSIDAAIDRITSGQTVAFANNVDAFRNRLIKLIDDMMNAGAGTGIEQYIDENYTADDEFRWVVSSGGNVCPDCKGRSGQVHTWEYWQYAGTPKSGWSICGNNCRCQLVPIDNEQAAELSYTPNRRARNA